MSEQPLGTAFAVVRGRIAAAAQAAARTPEAVALVAVSKFHPAAAVRAAYALGQRDFGENRVQELLAKARELADLADLRWHMIGSLQTNKVRDLLAVPGLVLLHSLDRVRLADALEGELARTGASLRVLLQVHATAEPTKHGCAPEQAAELLRHVRANCPHLLPEGVMGMGPAIGDPAPVFARLAAVLGDLRAASGLPLPIASFGMSGDLEVAIAHGATIVRVGTDLFGARG